MFDENQKDDTGEERSPNLMVVDCKVMRLMVRIPLRTGKKVLVHATGYITASRPTQSLLVAASSHDPRQPP